MSFVEPQTHEVKGNMLFDEHGVQPYWALRSIFSHEINGGAKKIEVEVDGEIWQVSLNHQKSGMEPTADDEVDQLYEYRMNAYGRGERKIPILIQPRLDWSEDKRPNSVPDDLDESVNCRIETAVNVEPIQIKNLVPQLLASVFDQLGVQWYDQYFTGPLHEYSNLTTWELYARVNRGIAQRLVEMDGILWSIFHLLGDLEGSKFEYSSDNTEIIGYNHQVRIDTKAANQLLPGNQHGKQLKHYHPQHVRDDSRDDDPLYHPKFGVCYKSTWDDDGSVKWSNRSELRAELHDNLVNILEWADIPTDPDSGAFVEDDHFNPVSSERTVTLYDDPTPEIEASQHSILTKTLMSICDSEREQEMLKQVAYADGGRKHVSELEDSVGSSSTIYRALDKLSGVLESDNGNVQYVSEKIREQVTETINVTKDVIESKTQILEDMLSVDPDDLERAGRAWQNWMNRYGAEIMEVDGRKTIRVREIMSLVKSKAGEYAPEIVEWGRIAWQNAGRDPAEFDNAVVVWDAPNGGTNGKRVSWLIRQE